MAAAIWSAHALVQVFSSVMSFISSLLIACTVAWPGNGGLSTPFRRIIFGLSSCYIIVSVALISGPWMVPRSVGVEYDFWGIGNKTTCQAVGFLFTVGSTGTAFYTCVLCLYYLAKLKWKMSDNTLWHKYEKKIHLFIIIYRIAVGVAALSLDILHTGVNGAACTVALTPYGCRHEPELVGECTNNRSTVNAFIFFDIYLIVLLVFVFIVATMITLILHADFLKKLNEREIALSVAEDGSSRHDFGLDIDTEPNNTRNPETVDESSESPSNGKKESQSVGNATLGESLSTGVPNTLPQRSSVEQENDSTTSTVERQARAQAASDLSRLYFNETMLQAKLYVGCFFISYIPLILISIAIITSPNTSARGDVSLLVNILSFIVVFFYPLGGFMNILVYSRPNVARLRRLHPEISRLKAFWMVFRAGGEVTSVENTAQPTDNQLARYNHSPERKRKISNSTKDPFGVARVVAGREDLLDFVSSDVAMNGRSETFAEGDPRFTPPSDWTYEEGGNSNLNLPSFSDDQGEKGKGPGKQKDVTDRTLRRVGKVSSLFSRLSFFSEETKNNNSNLSFASRDLGLDSEDWQSEIQST